MVLNTETHPTPKLPSLIPSWAQRYHFAMDQHDQWAQQGRHQSNASIVDIFYFDFVAHTDCSVQLHPEEFWRDNPMLNAPPGNRSKVFAQGDEFTLLSSDLVKKVVVNTRAVGRSTGPRPSRFIPTSNLADSRVGWSAIGLGPSKRLQGSSQAFIYFFSQWSTTAIFVL